ncbi:MAG TPA: tetratricopeptide repeat protein [Bryobacteraceae bacterium]|jgi:tetratricopeptide (TPR) repeat protein|nr:tetratricopeptide repeat protein [Bryobacteraceae bacterium]HXJ38387.1 tetratricopeptide repeat protein [Bryobacteraceae bacterium]
MQTISSKTGVRATALLGVLAIVGLGQEVQELSPASPPATTVKTLPLDATKRSTIEEAIANRNYTAAEDLLAAEAAKSPKSQPLLLVLADILFLDGKQLNSALVLKKAELLGPLDERSRFLLALSYVAISRKNLAIAELERLAQSNPSNAVYPYWLSRLAYRKTDVQQALQYAEKAVRLDPLFMKAYDQLGLCHAGLNQTEEAIQAYKEAIRLNQQQALHWPWPSMNLGTLLLRLDRLDEAEAHLRDSINIEPRFPVAHLRLGQLLEKKERYLEAIAELELAAKLDPTYPEPHYALGRIYRQRKDAKAAETELGVFQDLRKTDKLKGITRPD